jgi:hypothetical protein
MGMQKYRADRADLPTANGAIMWRSLWMGGPSPAKVENCPIGGVGAGLSPRTVYVMGEADTYFSIPAAIAYRGKRINGSLYCDEDAGGWHFHPYNNQIDKLEG